MSKVKVTTAKTIKVGGKFVQPPREIEVDEKEAKRGMESGTYKRKETEKAASKKGQSDA